MASGPRGFVDDETAEWEVPRGRARTRRRRRGSSVGRVVRRLLAIILLGLVAAGVVIGVRSAAFNNSVSSASLVSTALLGPLNGAERVNVALIGYGGPEHEGPFLADSIVILSVDPTTNTTTAIPVPRDLWIEGVPALPNNGKINEAFSVGYSQGGIDAGGAVLTEALSAATGLRVTHWLAIDFAGFSEMVDAVGGVRLHNPVAFSYTMSEAAFRAGSFDGGSFAAGELHLDGPAALAYARARYTNVASETGDYARGVRQARVLAALADGLGEGGLGAIGPGLALMDAVENRLRTSLSVIDLFLLGGHIGADQRLELTEGEALVATSNSIGQYILVPAGWTGPGDYGSLHVFVADRLVGSR
jgi:polyisoprenyl-teichoic acid--peptidoglycan teichoic acid transferase